MSSEGRDSRWKEETPEEKAKKIIEALRMGIATGTTTTLTADQARFIMYSTDLTAWEKKR